MKHYRWSELNELGKSNQAYYLANLMYDSMRVLDVDGWPGHKVAYFYLDAEFHLEPKPFGGKVTIPIAPDKPAPTKDDLILAILNY